MLEAEPGAWCFCPKSAAGFYNFTATDFARFYSVRKRDLVIVCWVSSFFYPPDRNIILWVFLLVSAGLGEENPPRYLLTTVEPSKQNTKPGHSCQVLGAKRHLNICPHLFPAAVWLQFREKDGYCDLCWGSLHPSNPIMPIYRTVDSGKVEPVVCAPWAVNICFDNVPEFRGERCTDISANQVKICTTEPR